MEDDYLKCWIIVRRYVHRKTKGRIALFGSDSEHRDWCKSIASLGLALAIKNVAQWDESRGSFHWWACLNVRNVMRAELGGEARFFELQKTLAKEPPPRYADPLAGLLDREQIDAALAQLTPDQREAVALSCEYELPMNEIEQIMERDRGAIDALLYRARRKLESLLGSSEPGRPALDRDLPAGSKSRAPRARSQLEPADEPPAYHPGPLRQRRSQGD
jgi:RNA polymerase sigma factor (sigma-70 family)